MWIQYLLQLLSGSTHTVCQRSSLTTFESRPWLTSTHLGTTAGGLISIMMYSNTNKTKLTPSKALLGRSEDFPYICRRRCYADALNGFGSNIPIKSFRCLPAVVKSIYGTPTTRRVLTSQPTKINRPAISTSPHTHCINSNNFTP